MEINKDIETTKVYGTKLSKLQRAANALDMVLEDRQEREELSDDYVKGFRDAVSLLRLRSAIDRQYYAEHKDKFYSIEARRAEHEER